MKTKVPGHVRDAIRNAAKYRAKAGKYEDIIENWFEKMGIQDDDEIRDTYIDYVQQSFDPEAAIKHFESYVK